MESHPWRVDPRIVGLVMEFQPWGVGSGMAAIHKLELNFFEVQKQVETMNKYFQLVPSILVICGIMDYTCHQSCSLSK